MWVHAHAHLNVGVGAHAHTLMHVGVGAYAYTCMHMCLCEGGGKVIYVWTLLCLADMLFFRKAHVHCIIYTKVHWNIKAHS